MSRFNKVGSTRSTSGLTLDEFLDRQAAAKVGIEAKSNINVSVKAKSPPTAVKTIRELIYWEYAIDHIIPLIKGEPDITSNKTISCKRCNSSKLDNDIFEWYYLLRKEQEIPKLV